MKTNLQKFLDGYQGTEILDLGAFLSKEFKDFANGFKRNLKKGIADSNIHLVSFSVGHYDFFGFLEKEGKYLYFSYSLSRGMSCDFTRGGPYGFLYRKCSGPKDYRGERNNFCPLYEADKAITSFLS